MRLLSIINKAICVGCAAIGAFCVGYALASGQHHVFFTAFLSMAIAFCCITGERQDRKREEEEQRRKASHE